MIDLTMASLLPLLITSVTAASVSYLLTGTEAMFQFHLDYPFALERIPYAIALGIFCGLVAWYFTRAMNWIENNFPAFILKSLCQVCDRSCYAEYPDLPFPSALW